MVPTEVEVAEEILRAAQQGGRSSRAARRISSAASTSVGTTSVAAVHSGACAPSAMVSAEFAGAGERENSIGATRNRDWRSVITIVTAKIPENRTGEEREEAERRRESEEVGPWNFQSTFRSRASPWRAPLLDAVVLGHFRSTAQGLT